LASFILHLKNPGEHIYNLQVLRVIDGTVNVFKEYVEDLKDVENFSHIFLTTFFFVI